MAHCRFKQGSPRISANSEYSTYYRSRLGYLIESIYIEMVGIFVGRRPHSRALRICTNADLYDTQIIHSVKAQFPLDLCSNFMFNICSPNTRLFSFFESIRLCEYAMVMFTSHIPKMEHGIGNQAILFRRPCKTHDQSHILLVVEDRSYLRILKIARIDTGSWLHLP